MRNTEFLPSSNLGNSNKEWLISPTLDLLLVCGGLMWFLFIIQQWYLATGSPALNGYSAGCLIVSVMIAELHVMATWARLYEEPSLRIKHPLLSNWSFVLIPVAIITLCLCPIFLSIVAMFYVIASVHHGLSQSYGISLIYCKRSRYKVNSSDRKTVKLLINSIIVFAILRQFALPEFAKTPLRGVDVFFLQIFPSWLPYAVLLISALIAVLILAKTMVKIFDQKSFPWPSFLVIGTSLIAVIFAREIAGDFWIFVPGFFHGSQYLIVSHCHRIGKDKTRLGSISFNQSTMYFFSLLIAAFVIYGAVPKFLQLFGVSFSTSTAAVFLVFVLHHFALDAKIWHLKDASVSKPLEIV